MVWFGLVRFGWVWFGLGLVWVGLGWVWLVPVGLLVGWFWFGLLVGWFGLVGLVGLFCSVGLFDCFGLVMIPQKIQIPFLASSRLP